MMRDLEREGFMFATFVKDQFSIIHYQHGLIGWLLIGLVAGWLAGTVSRGRGFGCITDIVLGLIGSFLGGWIFLKLHIGPPGNTGFLYSLAAATVGAVLLVTVARLFSGSDRR
jgi:uncharacterized membrane protein YeaQ/YmgE (transglycosylase-associated protein family)